jgi:CRISPR-associated endonuclease/helicase Cas3
MATTCCASKEAIAHVKKNENNEWEIHSLEEHLLEVARISSEMASIFGAQDWAYLAGKWHDLGKYRSKFQNYIAGVSGYDLEAHIEQGRVDHSTAGAIYAVDQLGKLGRILAYIIAGHHAGLPDWNSAEEGRGILEKRLDEGKKAHYLVEALANPIPKKILQQEKPTSKSLGGSEGFHLWVRMLFSCLVDADFLDTEAFMSPEKQVTRSNWPAIAQLKKDFDGYMLQKTTAAKETPVNKIRAKILKNCREAALMSPGIFTLTVPTGGGKTLSGMAFALDHALNYNKTRIIVAIPYTSIIEQTADQYRDIFPNAVVEHHSNLDPHTENAKSRLATENWDAPIIVTTNVQLLESLFAAKTSRCRKLHNIINSVIIIDEAQLLPPEFLQPVLDALRMLSTHYGVTLVLSTATQPALATIKNEFNKTVLRGLDNVKEIIADISGLYQVLNRVDVEKPKDMTIRMTWKNLAHQLQEHDSVLVIVNTRKDCRALYDLMPGDTIHLSGFMCGQHRSNTIAEIKKRLRDGEPVRVISTQLVEAGVDLDFPVVYRALSGLDSIAQAAGRCNREGKLDKGRVVIFIPENPSPKGMLLAGEQATKNVWYDRDEDLLSPNLYPPYFKEYFGAENNDKNGIIDLLVKDASHFQVQFRSAAKKFKLIDDENIHQILVPYQREGEKLINLLRESGPERYLLRKLQRYSVSVYKNAFEKLKKIGAIEEVSLGLWAVCVSNAYDDQIGLLLADDLYSADPASMIL